MSTKDNSLVHNLNGKIGKLARIYLAKSNLVDLIVKHKEMQSYKGKGFDVKEEYGLFLGAYIEPTIGGAKLINVKFLMPDERTNLWSLRPIEIPELIEFVT